MIRGTWRDDNGNWWTQEGGLSFDENGDCTRRESPPRPATQSEIDFAIELTTPELRPMNVIIMPGNILCEGCGQPMGIQALKEWDPNVAHILVVCAHAPCLRKDKVLKFPLTRASCGPAIAGSEKAQSALVLPH